MNNKLTSMLLIWTLMCFLMGAYFVNEIMTPCTCEETAKEIALLQLEDEVQRRATLYVKDGFEIIDCWVECHR